RRSRRHSNRWSANRSPEPCWPYGPPAGIGDGPSAFTTQEPPSGLAGYPLDLTRFTVPGPHAGRVGGQHAPCPACGKTQRSGLELVAGLEHPPDEGQADREKAERGAEADDGVDIGLAVEAPAQPADQIDHGVEQGDPVPERRQHVDRVEGATE